MGSESGYTMLASRHKSMTPVRDQSLGTTRIKKAYLNVPCSLESEIERRDVDVLEY